MRKNKRWSHEEKLTIVLKHVNEGHSFTSLEREYNCSTKLIRRWVSKDQFMGQEGLKRKHRKTVYTTETKEEMIHEVFNGRTQEEIAQACGLSQDSLLSSWIKAYTGGKKSTGKGRVNRMKGRKTTLEERLEIVDFSLRNDRDHQSAAEKYNVSYQQVYSWVQK
ncbi:transposase [Salisediminibacterium beveridgei]|nr:transposase [Salisediminibacterium beveridgei]